LADSGLSPAVRRGLARTLGAVPGPPEPQALLPDKTGP
jgi:hypothetical protein